MVIRVVQVASYAYSLLSYPAVVAWSVKASTQIQVELDFAGGGSNPAWDENVYMDEFINLSNW